MSQQDPEIPDRKQIHSVSDETFERLIDELIEAAEAAIARVLEEEARRSKAEIKNSDSQAR